MEIGFIIIMLCLVIMASTFIYLVYTHRNRSCKSCKFFRPTANNKYSGTCNSKYSGTCNGFGHHRFHWECCGEWKRKTTKQEDEL